MDILSLIVLYYSAISLKIFELAAQLPDVRHSFTRTIAMGPTYPRVAVTQPPLAMQFPTYTAASSPDKSIPIVNNSTFEHFLDGTAEGHFQYHANLLYSSPATFDDNGAWQSPSEHETPTGASALHASGQTTLCIFLIVMLSCFFLRCYRRRRYAWSLVHRTVEPKYQYLLDGMFTRDSTASAFALNRSDHVDIDDVHQEISCRVLHSQATYLEVGGLWVCLGAMTCDLQEVSDYLKAEKSDHAKTRKQLGDQKAEVKTLKEKLTPPNVNSLRSAGIRGRFGRISAAKSKQSYKRPRVVQHTNMDAETEKAVRALMNENEEMESQVSPSLSTDQANLAQDIVKMKTELKAVTSQKLKASESKKRAMNELSELQYKLKGVTSQKAKAADSRMKVANELFGLKRKIKSQELEISEKKEQTRKELSELETKLRKDGAQRKTTVTNEVTGLEKKLKKLRSENEELDGDKFRLKKEAAALKRTCEDTKEQSETLSNKRDHLEMEVATLKQRCEDLQSQKASLQRESAQLARELTTDRQEHLKIKQALRSRQQAAESEHTKKLSALEREVGRYRKANQSLREEKCDLEKDISRCRNHNLDERAARKQETDGWKRDIHALQQELSDAKASKAQLVDEMQQENAQLQQYLAEARSSFAALGSTPGFVAETPCPEGAIHGSSSSPEEGNMTVDDSTDSNLPGSNPPNEGMDLDSGDTNEQSEDVGNSMEVELTDDHRTVQSIQTPIEVVEWSTCKVPGCSNRVLIADIACGLCQARGRSIPGEGDDDGDEDDDDGPDDDAARHTSDQGEVNRSSNTASQSAGEQQADTTPDVSSLEGTQHAGEVPHNEPLSIGRDSISSTRNGETSEGASSAAPDDPSAQRNADEPATFATAAGSKLDDEDRVVLARLNLNRPYGIRCESCDGGKTDTDFDDNLCDNCYLDEFSDAPSEPESDLDADSDDCSDAGSPDHSDPGFESDSSSQYKERNSPAPRFPFSRPILQAKGPSGTRAGQPMQGIGRKQGSLSTRKDSTVGTALDGYSEFKAENEMIRGSMTPMPAPSSYPSPPPTYAQPSAVPQAPYYIDPPAADPPTDESATPVDDGRTVSFITCGNCKNQVNEECSDNGWCTDCHFYAMSCAGQG